MVGVCVDISRATTIISKSLTRETCSTAQSLPESGNADPELSTGLPPPPLPDREDITEAESKKEKDIKLNRIARRESQRLEESDDTSLSSLRKK